MTKITSSSLLGGSNKIIKPYECSFIATEGPNIMGKLNLNYLEIPYDSFFVSKMRLTTNVDTPVMYGFLGNDVTLIIIKVTYTGSNPQCCDETDNFIEYWFRDDLTTVRYIGQLLILTGNSTHKIPQIFLKNTTANYADVEIMVADFETVATAISTTTYGTFVDLYWNSIISDKIYTLIGTGATYATGSTELIVLDSNGNSQAVVEYSKINNIEKSSNQLILYTNTDNIVLEFLTEYYAYQALSRINWVMEGLIGSITQSDYYMTVSAPGFDNSEPVITTWSGATITGMTLSGVSVLTEANIRDYFIKSIADYDDLGLVRDGVIDTEDMTVLIYKNGSLLPLTGITEDGKYAITFQIRDVANNLASVTKSLWVDDVGPVFNLNTITNTAITFCDINNVNCTIPASLTKNWLRSYYIDSVTDAVDGTISLSSVSIDISSGVTTGLTSITTVGNYYVTFTVSDASLNTTVTGLTTLVREDLAPVLVFNLAYTGSTFNIHSGYTLSATGFTGEVVSAVTDTYQPSLGVSNVVLTDSTDVALTYPIPTGTAVKLKVTNLSLLSDTETKTITVIT